MRAYPDVDHASIVSQVYEESLGRHLTNLPHLDERETTFHPDYTYKRAETIEQLLKNSAQQEEGLRASKIIDELRQQQEKCDIVVPRP